MILKPDPCGCPYCGAVVEHPLSHFEERKLAATAVCKTCGRPFVIQRDLVVVYSALPVLPG